MIRYSVNKWEKWWLRAGIVTSSFLRSSRIANIKRRCTVHTYCAVSAACSLNARGTRMQIAETKAGAISITLGFYPFIAIAFLFTCTVCDCMQCR